MEKYVQPEGGCSSSLHGGENIEPPYSRQIDADSKVGYLSLFMKS